MSKVRIAVHPDLTAHIMGNDEYAVDCLVGAYIYVHIQNTDPIWVIRINKGKPGSDIVKLVAENDVPAEIRLVVMLLL